MLKLFRRGNRTVCLSENQSCFLDISSLRDDERLEFRYDQHQNLVAIQKIRLALLDIPMTATAATDIEPGQIGQVFYQGSYWSARCDDNTKIQAGQSVLVIARHDLILLVIPAG
jgi:hypothetical protein